MEKGTFIHANSSSLEPINTKNKRNSISIKKEHPCQTSSVITVTPKKTTLDVFMPHETVGLKDIFHFVEKL